MRLLYIEDEPEMHSVLRAEVEPLGIEVDTATHADEALAKVRVGGYDLIVCDLKIPASLEAPEPHKEHGIRVYDSIRVDAPGVPVIIFSAFGELADLGDRFSEAQPQDLFGRGPEKIAIGRTKSQLVEVVGLIRRHHDALESLDSEIEVSGAEARAVLSELDVRLVSMHARRYGGTAAKVRLLTGGKSDARTLKIETEHPDGTPASRVVAKLHDLNAIEDEERRYELYVASLLDAGTYTNRLETRRAGAQHRGGLFYSVAGRYDASLFDVLRRSPTDAAAIVAEIRSSLTPWHGDPVVEQQRIGDVRRLLVSDARLADLRAEPDCLSEELEALETHVRSAPAHGDLHGENILVAPDNRSILIDFGRVGPAVNAVDPVTLELSAVLHPDAALDLSDWPTREQAEGWQDRSFYLEGCPVAEFIEACRDWSDAVSRGDRETDAVVYGYALRQLLFDDVDLELAAAYSRGAASRLSGS